MRKLWIVFCLCVFALYGCTITERELEYRYFDPEKYLLVEDGISDRFIPETMEDMEKRARYVNSGEANPYGLILECTVAGPSFNRIMEPEYEDMYAEDGSVKTETVYGVNHVLTPVKVEKIHYRGSEVELEEGEVRYLKEPFYYLEKESEIWGDNVILMRTYVPIQQGERYLMYLHCQQSDLYDYEGQPILGTLGLGEAVYSLGVLRDGAEVSYADVPQYEKILQEVRQTYGG